MNGVARIAVCAMLVLSSLSQLWRAQSARLKTCNDAPR